MVGSSPLLPDSFSPTTSTIYKNHVILGLDPRIHAASHGPTNVLAEPAFRGGSWFLQPGVDGRVKPDHDNVFENAGILNRTAVDQVRP
jgi:hypothetical protein